MDAWMIWIAIGVICVIIEIFTPGFLFMSFGIGAIITGLIERLFSIPVAYQILIFAMVTFIIFIFTRKLSKKIISEENEPTNVNALVGKKGTVTKEIVAGGRGYVKIGGEEWSAVAVDEAAITAGKTVKIEKIEGNKLIVSPLEQE